MELVDEQKILRYLKRLMEISTIQKPTQEDLEEKKAVTKELSILMAKVGIKDLNALINSVDESDTETELEKLIQEEKDLELQMKILKKKESIESMKTKLKEAKKENSYISGKPDKYGVVPIDEEKYNRKLDALKQEMFTAKTSKEKIEAKLKIINLMMWKGTIKAHNGALKTARKAGQVADFVQGLSKEMGKLSQYSGFEENEKKTKKGKPKPQSFEIQDDFGFSQEKVFDKKYKF